MERTRRWGLVCNLVEAMGEAGSWVGETHIQKSSLFLQEMLKVQMGYKFVLYLHGPYSFDLSEELSEMRARGILSIEARGGGYGPSFRLGYWGERLEDWVGPSRGESLQLEARAVEFVAQNISTKNARELERISTAFFLMNKSTDGSDVAKWINGLKPHISVEASRIAIRQVTQLQEDVSQLQLIELRR